MIHRIINFINMKFLIYKKHDSRKKFEFKFNVTSLNITFTKNNNIDRKVCDSVWKVNKS